MVVLTKLIISTYAYFSCRMYDKQILRSDKWLAYLFQNGRHLQATLIISSQYAMSLPPEFRSQVDYAYCFMLNSRGDKEKV